MVDCIVWERPDGGVSIQTPAYKDLARPKRDTNAKLIARCIEKNLERMEKKFGPGCIPHICNIKRILTDDHFFDAWHWTGGADKAIEVDMVKARSVHMRRIRAPRDEALAVTDIPFRKAMEEWIRTETPESRVAAMAIADHAQMLRDIPQTFDLEVYLTPEDLKAAWPEVLK